MFRYNSNTRHLIPVGRAGGEIHGCGPIPPEEAARQLHDVHLA